MEEFLSFDIGNCKVGEVDRVHAEFRLIGPLLHACGKEREFISELPSLCVKEMAREIPPLDAVTALKIEVPGQFHDIAGSDVPPLPGLC